jgi:hypothetical protein
VNAIPEVDDVGIVTLPLAPTTHVGNENSVPFINSSVNISSANISHKVAVGGQHRVPDNVHTPSYSSIAVNQGMLLSEESSNIATQGLQTDMSVNGGDNGYIQTTQMMASIANTQSVLFRERAAILARTIGPQVGYAPQMMRLSQSLQQNLLPLSQLSQQSNGAMYPTQFGLHPPGNRNMPFDFTEHANGMI